MELRLGGARAEREEHGLAAARRRGRTGEEPRGTAVEREHGGEGRGHALQEKSHVETFNFRVKHALKHPYTHVESFL